MGHDVSLKPGADGEVEVNVIDICEVMEEDQVFGVLKLAEQLDLTQEEQGRLTALLSRWEKVFSAHDEDFGRTDVIKHCIPTGNAASIRECFRPI